jgi:hypothetical protein
MKNINIKIIEKALKDAKRRGIKEMMVKDKDGNLLKIEEIEVSNITGMVLRLK